MVAIMAMECASLRSLLVSTHFDQRAVPLLGVLRPPLQPLDLVRISSGKTQIVLSIGDALKVNVRAPPAGRPRQTTLVACLGDRRVPE